MRPRHTFRPQAGGRVIGGVYPPKPSDQQFEPNTTVADPTFVVGVVDTGLVRQNNHIHPWLVGHVYQDSDNDDPLPEAPAPVRPDDGHGTFVTGLILREAPAALVRVRRAIDRDRIPADGDTLVDPARGSADDLVARAILDLVGDDTHPPASIINLSFCGDLWEEPPPDGIRRAIEIALDREIVVIAAAGNDPDGVVLWPAAFALGFENMYAVGALDEEPTRLAGPPPPKASFSNHGPWVSVYAPGVDVLGPLYSSHPSILNPGFHGWARWSGTSFAAATVSGRIARFAIDNSISAVDAAVQVLGDKVKIPGVPGEGFGHYVQSSDSAWPVAAP